MQEAGPGTDRLRTKSSHTHLHRDIKGAISHPMNMDANFPAPNLRINYG